MSQINVNEIYDAYGGKTAVLNGTLNTPLGMRNKIINGAMVFAQRGLSFSDMGTGNNGAYVLDRWWCNFGGTARGTVSQETDVPAGSGLRHSMRFTVTTADTSIAAGDYFAFGQKIEGYNVSDLVGRTFTLSFWVRSSVAGTYCIRLGNEITASTNSRVYIAPYTVNSANTWEFKSITVTGGIPASGTWDFGTGTGLGIRFTMMAGSTFHSTSGSWLANVDSLCTSAQVNAVNGVGNIFALTGVQLEVGEVATPFEHRPITIELALCQRYYETGTARILFSAPAADYYGSTTIQYKVNKRVQGSVYNSGALTNTNAKLMTLWHGYTDSVGSYAVSVATGVVEYVHTWYADAEL